MVRQTDTVARLAGDEFVILLEGLSERDTDVAAVAEKVIAAVSTPFDLAEGSVSTTVSIGAAVYRGDGPITADALLNNADKAMYQAKHSGKNTFRVHA